MSKGERDDLLRLARSRAKLAKTRADERAKILLAEAEDLMAAEYDARDRMWGEAVEIAEEHVRKANEVIVARCADLGIPARYAPRVGLGWEARRSEFASSQRRGELRKVAEKRVSALIAAAKSKIDEGLLDSETELLAGGLESEGARAALAAMPSAESLMPPLSLDDLGVRTWQPPEGAAAQLVTPSTPADRKRRKILRAIEQHPAASDREIARLAGCDHHTVARYRAARGELPAGGGESPSGGDAR